MRRWNELMFILSLFLLLATPEIKAQVLVLKFGTLAPADSEWMLVWEKVVKEIVRESEGKIKITTYPGGVMGDEPEMIRKARLGQLHILGLTIDGLKHIAPEIGFIDMPFLIKSYEEADRIIEKFSPKMGQYIENKDFVLLLMVDHGFVYWFSSKDVRSFEEIGKTRVWAWFGNPLMKKEAELLGTSPIFLFATDVLSGLETGMIHSVSLSPLACLSLQWCKLIKTAIDVPYKYEPAGIIISKKLFNQIPQEMREIIERKIRGARNIFNTQVREGDKKALEKLRKTIKFVNPPDTEWFARKAEREIWFNKDMGHSIELLKEVIDELKKMRQQ